MPNILKYLFLINFILLISFPLFSDTTEQQQVDKVLKVRSFKSAGKPIIWQNYLILRFEGNREREKLASIFDNQNKGLEPLWERQDLFRSVSAAFAHENFSKIHTFSRNQHGIYVLMYPLPESIIKGEHNKILYRLVVDGLWMPDPHCREKETQTHGFPLSRISFQGRIETKTISPQLNQSMATFIYIDREHLYSNSGGEKQITLVGDFNNWDPFMHSLNYQGRGKYSLSIPITPGKHYYFFIVNGLRMIDPLNTEIRLDENYEEYSFFMMP